MQLSDITPLVLTYNEDANIGRTLSHVAWADRVVVVDSFSTDNTAAICRRHTNVDFVQRAFDDHATQWNHGLAQVQTPWVLSLDADYLLSEDVVAELERLAPSGDLGGYSAEFVYCVFGRPLRASLYPSRVVLFRRDRSRYEQDGHTQRLAVSGRTETLRARLLHDDRKPVDRWLVDQARYAAQEAAWLANPPASGLNRFDRLRRKGWLAPLAVTWYALVVRGLILDGWPGWYYVLQRTIAETMLALRIVDRRLRLVSSADEHRADVQAGGSSRTTVSHE